MRIGVHVSIAGKIYESVDRAQELGCETMQIFSRNPRNWSAPKIEQADADEFRKRRKAAGIFPVLVHIPYLINLASPDPKLYKRSIDAYVGDLNRGDLIGAEYFVTHLGSHVGTGEDAGIRRFSEAINIILKKTDPKTMILLENTSGSGSSIGHSFVHLKKIIAGIKKTKKIGVCLDTQHAYGAGYDLRSKKGLENMLAEFERLVGLDRLKALHLNDSKVPLGSRKDRHEHIGEGEIGMAAFKRIVTHPELRHLPFVMETPKNDPSDDIRNLKTVKSIR